MGANTKPKPRLGAFLSDQSSDALDHVVPVGKANEYVEYVNDLMSDGTLADLDPINQLIMLEEMDEHEALQFVTDLYYLSKYPRKT